MLGDKAASVRRGWWYALLAVVILLIPGYFLLKSAFVNLLVAGYDGPALVQQAQNKQPLQVLEKKIFALGNNAYSGYVKIKNINLEWGVAEQSYTAEFKTYGGTILQKYDRNTFILPASEKLIVLPSFTSDKKPDDLDFSLSSTHFIRKPDVAPNFDLERTIVQNTAAGLAVSSAIRNMTPFTVKEIDLPVAVFNSKNEIVAVNFTYLNEIKSSETRTFRYTWPQQVAGAIRAEINPEMNIFDRNVFESQPGVSPFQDQSR